MGIASNSKIQKRQGKAIGKSPRPLLPFSAFRAGFEVGCEHDACCGTVDPAFLPALFFRSAGCDEDVPCLRGRRVLVEGFDCHAGKCFAELRDEVVDNGGHRIFFARFAERITDDHLFNFPAVKQRPQGAEQPVPVEGPDRLGEEPERIAFGQPDALCTVIDGEHSFFYHEASVFLAVSGEFIDKTFHFRE
jgi:hypothetical protein